MAEIVLEDVWKIYPGRHRGRSRPRPRHRRRRVHGARRPVRLRQDDGAAHGRRASRSISRARSRSADRVVNDVPPKDRDIAMVFQNYALYPHMSVFDNMAFGLKLQKMPKAEIDERVREAAGSSASASCWPASRPPSPEGSGSGWPWAGHRPPPAGLPHGRTALEPRRQAPRADALRDRPDPARPRGHHDLRHPRPDRGHDDGRPGRGASARASCSRSTPRRRSTTTRPTSSSPGSSAHRR